MYHKNIDLKARLPGLRRLRVHPDKACDIVLARVILHNSATFRGNKVLNCLLMKRMI